MKRIFALTCLAALLLALGACCILRGDPDCDSQDDGWITLFDGTFNGWKASENTECFSIQNGEIVANGKRSHLFYDGPVMDHDFTNFELTVDVMTMPKANGGVYIHTEFQQDGWPAKGYEIQVNNSHKDWRRTGSLYSIEDIREKLVDDKVWFTEHITVQGKQITIKVDGETVVDYTEPENPERPANMKGRILSHGTIALQGHDPGSTVHFKNIRIKPLP